MSSETVEAHTLSLPPPPVPGMADSIAVRAVLNLPEILGQIISEMAFSDILLRARAVNSFWKEIVDQAPICQHATFLYNGNLKDEEENSANVEFFTPFSKFFELDEYKYRPELVQTTDGKQSPLDAQDYAFFIVSSGVDFRFKRVQGLSSVMEALKPDENLEEVFRNPSTTEEPQNGTETSTDQILAVMAEPTANSPAESYLTPYAGKFFITRPPLRSLKVHWKFACLCEHSGGAACETLIAHCEAGVTIATVLHCVEKHFKQLHLKQGHSAETMMEKELFFLREVKLMAREGEPMVLVDMHCIGKDPRRMQGRRLKAGSVLARIGLVDPYDEDTD